MPGGIFIRAFVRSYAVEVGLNPEETVREFLDRFQGEPAAPTAAAAPPLSEDETNFESRRRMASLLLRVVIVVVVAGAAAAYAAYRWRSVVLPPVESIPAPPAAPTAAPAGAQLPALPAATDSPAKSMSVMTLVCTRPDGAGSR